MGYLGNDPLMPRSFAVLLAMVWLGSCRNDQTGPTKTSMSRDTVPELASSLGVVEVLNGTARKGAANLVAERLRKRGYDVVKIGNASEHNYSRTLVAERRTNPGVSMGVAKAIGVQSTFPYHNENLLVDATVFVGRDFEEILPP